jgi:DNA invertase Pin-like site-specific DNA recombinase
LSDFILIGGAYMGRYDIAREKGIRVDGRPKKNIPIDIFQKFRAKQKGGELTVEECCNRLNISRSTWYNKLKEV